MITDIDIAKKAIRLEVKQLKAAITLEHKKELSSCILQDLENCDYFNNAKTVMLYWSMTDEVYTHDFVIKWANYKRIILPCVEGDNLVLREFTGIEDLKQGEQFGIPEPSGQLFNDIKAIDLIIVPGVAFDNNLNRMGRGKAFYDKLLINTTALKAAICFDFQVLSHIPTDEFDVKMDYIITEKQVISAICNI